MLQDHSLIVEASELFRKGFIQKSLCIYEKALIDLQGQKKIFKQEDNSYKRVITQKAHIQCTIGVICIILNKRQQAVKMFEKVIEVSQNFSVDSIVIIRALTNLVFLDLMQGRYSQGVEKFNLTIQIIDGGKNKAQLTQFLFRVLFRVESLKQLSNINISEYHSMNLIQALSISNIIMCKTLVIQLIPQLQDHQFNSVQFLIQAQHKCYQTFLHYKKYDLAVASLRNLILLNIPERVNSQENKENHQLRQGRCVASRSETQQNRLDKECIQFYKKQLGKILSSGIVNQDQIQFENTQIFAALRQIVKQLINYEGDLLKKGVISISKKQKNTNFWKFAVNYHFNSLLKIKNITVKQKAQFQKAKNDIINQKNSLIIRQLSQSQFVKKSLSSLFSHLDFIFSRLQNKMVEVQQLQIRKSFQNLNALVINQKQQAPLLRSQLSRRSFSKQNIRPTGIQIISPNRVRKSLSPLKKITNYHSNSNICSLAPKHSNQRQNSIQKQSLRFQKTFQQYQTRKINKMLRFCQHGSFLNKRNFTSDGGEFKFVKITQNLIKWGKNPEKVDEGGQCYAFKDVKGIIYGKMSPTLNKSENKLLKPYLCFSLILQKRTLDFYCKDYEQVEAWVCGLTLALHKIGQKVVGYTPGKMRWKKMLMILRYTFVDPLKRHQRNKFSNESAYSVIQFGKNNYTLPNELK